MLQPEASRRRMQSVESAPSTGGSCQAARTTGSAGAEGNSRLIMTIFLTVRHVSCRVSEHSRSSPCFTTRGYAGFRGAPRARNQAVSASVPPRRQPPLVGDTLA